VEFHEADSTACSNVRAAQQPVEIYKAKNLRAMVTMHRPHSAPQRPCPPRTLSVAQDELLSDGFPPFKERKSSSNQGRRRNRCTSAVQEARRRSSPSQSGSSSLRLRKGLAGTDICNTIEAGTIRDTKVRVVPFLHVSTWYANLRIFIRITVLNLVSRGHRPFV
jgi:hypothetical protein